MTLKEYKENSFLDIYSLVPDTPNGYLITNRGQIIKYHPYQQENIAIVAQLPQPEFLAFKAYLIKEEKILNTEYPQLQVSNPRKIIQVNLDGQKKDIINSSKEFTHNSQEEIYDRIYQEIQDIISLWGTTQE